MDTAPITSFQSIQLRLVDTVPKRLLLSESVHKWTRHAAKTEYSKTSPISNSEQSWPYLKSRDPITSSGISHTTDHSRNYSRYYINTPYADHGSCIFWLGIGSRFSDITWSVRSCSYATSESSRRWSFMG
jgi:hypothetical protein